MVREIFWQRAPEKHILSQLLNLDNHIEKTVFSMICVFSKLNKYSVQTSRTGPWTEKVLTKSVFQVNSFNLCSWWYFQPCLLGQLWDSFVIGISCFTSFEKKEFKSSYELASHTINLSMITLAQNIASSVFYMMKCTCVFKSCHGLASKTNWTSLQRKYIILVFCAVTNVLHKI